MIYIASPYAHEDLSIMHIRAEQAAKYAAHLMSKGMTCYSPIAHGHTIQEHLAEELRCNHKFWLNHDFDFVKNSTQYHLLALEGWQQSAGCKWEFETAKVFNIPTFLIGEVDLEQYGKDPFKDWPPF